MDKIIATIGVLSSFGIVTTISIQSIEKEEKLPIVLLLTLIAGYCLRRMGSKEDKQKCHRTDKTQTP